MLTCKVGQNTVNTIDYSDEQLRKWHKKDILKCPICNHPMYYRNGEIKVAYFAHQPGSDCVDTILGSEPETEEHRQSIKDIYLYLKQQEGISDIILESWIPETKQRPDITFIYKGEKYAIEVQCSPLATEYLERHRLYKLAGIKDIWILGIDKYKDNITTDGYFKTKVIERQILYKEDQRLMYYNCNNRQMNIVTENNIKAILDRKTTFNFIFIKKQLSEIPLDELLKETFYKQNEKTVLNLVEQLIKPQCEEIQYNFHISTLNKNVIAYFMINNEKYIIDYIPEYISLEDYNDLVDQYKELNIRPFIFLNYDFYRGIKENVVFKRSYYEEGQKCLSFEKCVNINMFFVYKNKITFFINNNDTKDYLQKNIDYKINDGKIDCYNYNQYVETINHKKSINNLQIKKATNCKIENIFSELKIFKFFEIKDLIFYDNNIINKEEQFIVKDIDILKKSAFNKLLEKNVKNISEEINRINKKAEKDRKLFNQFKNKIQQIFDKNNISYDLNYLLKLDYNNEIVYDNLIYFCENNKKYIIYTNNNFLHNDDGMNLDNETNKDTILIRLCDIQKYIEYDWILYKNYYGIISIDLTSNIKINVNYKYPKIKNDNNIYLFYKNKHKRIKKDIKYHYLPRI